MSSSLYDLFVLRASVLKAVVPLVIVVSLSIAIGLLMVIVFRYASDQKALRMAKDRLKAHLLAVRLFQDQLPVVLRSYARILGATGLYLRLAFKPLLLVILPLTFLIVQVDRFLGSVPMQVGEPFLLKARVANSDVLDQASLQLPTGLVATAPAVRAPADSEVVWRIVPTKAGNFDLNINVSGQAYSKRVVVLGGLARLSGIRLRGPWWKRMWMSAEPALPENSSIAAIEAEYPARQIAFAGLDWNWIWLFFVLSLIAGFLFKTILRIEI